MNQSSYGEILKRLKDDDIVVDIGGWEKPFNRANYVIDIMPYETRKQAQGHPKDMPERFTKESWLQLDILEEKMPFKDKEIDFIICGHVLEDIKDPIKLCREMMRVSKAGYIEVPSRCVEMNSNIDPYPGSHRYVGYCHHRWMVEKEENTLTFTPKTQVHSSVRSLRVRKVPCTTLSFFWTDSFETKEIFFSSFKDMVEDGLKFKMRNDGVSEAYARTLFKIENLIMKPMAVVRSAIKRKMIHHE